MQGKHWRILRKELASTTRFLRKKENLYREIKLWIFEVADFVVTCDFIYFKKKDRWTNRHVSRLETTEKYWRIFLTNQPLKCRFLY